MFYGKSRGCKEAWKFMAIFVIYHSKCNLFLYSLFHNGFEVAYSKNEHSDMVTNIKTWKKLK